MIKPVPPAAFLTTNPGIRTDLARLRNHCADILKWIDANSGGGGSITSITTATPGTVTITNPSGPVVNIDVVTAATGVTEVAAGQGIDVTSGTGPTATVSVEWGSGVNQVRHGNDAAYTDSRTPTGAAGSGLAGTYPNPTLSSSGVTTVTDPLYLKRAANDFNTFTHKTVPSSQDVLVLENADASGAKAYTMLSELFVAAYNPTNLAPFSWWRASTAVVTSGSAVDSFPDAGSGAKNFSQATAGNKATRGTDGSGDLYVEGDGSNDNYTAGVAADWTWMSDGTPWTIGIVTSRAAVVAGASSEAFLGTDANTSSNYGFCLTVSATSDASGGSAYRTGVVCLRNVGSNASYSCTYFTGSVNNQTDKHVEVWTHHGTRTVGDGVQASDYYAGQNFVSSVDGAYFRNGRRRTTASRGVNGSNTSPYTANAPPNTLRLFATGNGALFCKQRVYEIVFWKRVLTDFEVGGYQEYARSAYHLTF